MPTRSDPCPGCNHPWSCHMDTPKGCDSASVLDGVLVRCGCARKPPKKKLTPKKRAFIIGKVRAYRAPKFDDRVVGKPAPRPITPEERDVVEAAIRWQQYTRGGYAETHRGLSDAIERLLAARARKEKRK